jgi:hypothetical protein
LLILINTQAVAGWRKLADAAELDPGRIVLAAEHVTLH